MIDSLRVMATNSWGLIGHDWAVEMLSHNIANRFLRHAYLLHGIEGIGKQTLARAFAQALLCEQPMQPGVPCRHCRVCSLIAKQHHSDVIELHPTVGGNIIKTRSIKIEPIRELNYKISLRPVEAARRVAILVDFEAANEAAANALLKTLEEPPGDVIFILTANSLDTLLPTILSRCELFALRPLPLAQTQVALQSNWAALPAQAALLAHLAAGRLGWAVSVLQQPAILERRQQYIADLHHLLSARLVARFAFAEKIASDSEILYEMLTHWLSWWRDALLLANGLLVSDLSSSLNPAVAVSATGAITNVDDLPRLRAAATQIPMSQLASTLTTVQTALSQLERNINPRLLCEVLLLEWPYLKEALDTAPSPLHA